LKQRQEAIAVEQREAERLIELASTQHELFEERLRVALALLEHCYRLYVGATERSRRDLNQGFFANLFVDTDGVKRAILNPPFAQLSDMSIGFEDESDEDEGDGDRPDDHDGQGPQDG